MVSGKGFNSAALAVAGMFAVPAGVAAAAEDNVASYLRLGGGTVTPDEGPRDADSGIGGRLLVGWNLVEQLSVEAVLEYTSFEDKDPADSIGEYFRGNNGEGKSSRVSFGADFVWVPFRSWSPFASAGVGVARTRGDPRASDGVNLSTNLGLGLTSGGLGSSGVRLRAEARFVMDHYGDKPMDKYYFAGISFPLQRQAPRSATRAGVNEVAPAPSTRAPVEPVITVLPPLTPTPRPVIPDPAPPPAQASSARPQGDADRDGIDDTRDTCPATLLGVRVDEKGCAAEGAMVSLPGLNFRDGSATMETSSSAPLRQVAAFLRGQPSMTFELRGHTDSIGDPAANQKLSEERARSVARFLESEGIEGWRITATGFGESRQVADNGTAEGRAANRRVELRVLLP